jgi:ABC-2 type transport system permease protein
VVAWVIGGTAANYVITLSLAHEMDTFPGGPRALARSVQAGVEAMRPLRWPAERLDTLGGYLTYHNLILITFFLSVYAAVQGARAIRGGEERHSLEEVLATGRSRSTVLHDRATGFALTLGLIWIGLGLGVAGSMAAGGHPDLAGSLITVLASCLCAMAAYSLGVLVSQLTATSRSGAGAAALILTVLYVATNVADELGPFAAVRYVSPFHYANGLRALVPGHGFAVSPVIALVLMTGVLLAAAGWVFERRDYASPLWRRRPRAPERRPVRVQRTLLRTTWGAGLLRGRVGLLAWCGGTAAYAALLASLEPAVMDAWGAFESWAGFAGAGPGVAPGDAYLSLVGELASVVVTAYVVTQAAGWVADLDDGRVEVVLAAPVSWSRLVGERLFGAVVGVAAIAVSCWAGLAVSAAAAGVHVDLAGMARVVVDLLLLGAALAAAGAVVVAVLRNGRAVIVLAVFLGASYLLGVLVYLLDWPEWVTRLSVFGAFGHPYLEWPPLSGTLVLLVLAIPGGLAAAAIAERTPKVA